MPKLLPCDHCGRPAQNREGRPMWAGRMSSNPMYYKCAICKRPTELTAARWNALPEAKDWEILPGS